MTTDREPDFFDRDDDRLRCRECLGVFDIDSDWQDNHTGEHVGCPHCALTSRIPTAEESEWPNRKHPDDPMAGKSMVER